MMSELKRVDGQITREPYRNEVKQIVEEIRQILRNHECSLKNAFDILEAFGSALAEEKQALIERTPIGDSFESDK